jgi:hypothetical protein
MHDPNYEEEHEVCGCGACKQCDDAIMCEGGCGRCSKHPLKSFCLACKRCDECTDERHCESCGNCDACSATCIDCSCCADCLGAHFCESCDKCFNCTGSSEESGCLFCIDKLKKFTEKHTIVGKKREPLTVREIVKKQELLDADEDT